MMVSGQPAWKFAPLGQPFVPRSGTRKLEGIVFDVDGTLCQPQNYMFAEMRAALNIPKSVDILSHIYSLPTPEAQSHAMSQIRAIEARAVAHQQPQPGLRELMAYLDSRGVRKGICTRNFDMPVRSLLDKFLSDTQFEPIVTRDFRPPKPDPAGILFIARQWGLVRRRQREEKEEENGMSGEGESTTRTTTTTSVDGELSSCINSSTSQGNTHADGIDGFQPSPTTKHTPPTTTTESKEQEEDQPDASGLIMVGDSIDDMTAGRRAGARTVLLVNDVNRHLVGHEHTDYMISRLDELIDVLENGLL
ncbi:hypothetical protein VTJ04DRAFT_9876 [Mycothermus thermophilus]|uniref:uncharacterized protein n=1 Tax=Humicola insolens TaxID=85995 RepID=UPI0037435B78